MKKIHSSIVENNNVIYSYNTLSVRCYKECPARPVYGLTIPVGLLKCMQPKRVQTHERSEGVRPLRLHALQQAKGTSETLYRHAQALLWASCRYSVIWYFLYYNLRFRAFNLTHKQKTKRTHMTKAPAMLCHVGLFVFCQRAVALSACVCAIGMRLRYRPAYRYLKCLKNCHFSCLFQ